MKKQFPPNTEDSAPSTPRRGLWLLVVAALAVDGGLLAVGTWGQSSQVRTPVDRPVLINVASGPAPKTPVDEMVAKYALGADDWDTEVLSGAAKAQLKHVTQLATDLDAHPPEAIRGILTNDFSCTALGSLPESSLHEVFNDGRIRVLRLDLDPQATATVRPAHQGARGLAEALRQLVQGLGSGRHFRLESKIVRIDVVPGGFTTRVRVEATNRSEDSGVQQNAVWICHWIGLATNEKPRLARIDLADYEQVTVKTTDGLLFADCTESVLGQTPGYREHLLRGVGHWMRRLSRSLDTSYLSHYGLAVGDVNGDGREDVYACDSGGLPNRLYVQNPDGTVADRSREAGVDWLEQSRSALLVDLDNDGDQDLVVAMPLWVVIAQNDGRGNFRPRMMSEVVLDPMSMCAADYDNDADLDLFVCGYSAERYRGGLPQPVPFHDANNGGTNALLRNDGEFKFVDVTAEAGLDENNSRFSFAAAWEDYDNDGDLDLYVANDFGRNNLYRNTDGRFQDVARAAGVQDVATGMSVAWADYDRDGFMDVYVGNMFSSAGNRVTNQRRFRESQPGEVASQMQRMARGNTLFANAGDGTFQDVSETAAVTMGRWAWSSKFVDLNNDGWQDLVVANGYVTNEDTGDL